MKTNKEKKKFDAVKMMREIRDNISKETQGMKFDEFKKYVKAKLAESKIKPIGKKTQTVNIS